MKAMGLRAGFPDLQLMVGSKNAYGLLIELKTPKGVVSDVQEEYHAKLREQYYTVVICRSFNEAVTTIIDYLTNR